MLPSLNLRSNKTIFLISVGVITLFVLARLSFGGFNFSHFIVAEHHKGEIAVTSDVEVGTTFHIQFQLK